MVLSLFAVHPPMDKSCGVLSFNTRCDRLEIRRRRVIGMRSADAQNTENLPGVTRGEPGHAFMFGLRFVFPVLYVVSSGGITILCPPIILFAGLTLNLAEVSLRLPLDHFQSASSKHCFEGFTRTSTMAICFRNPTNLGSCSVGQSQPDTRVQENLFPWSPTVSQTYLQDIQERHLCRAAHVR